MSSAICFNLDQSKNLTSVKELNVEDMIGKREDIYNILSSLLAVRHSCSSKLRSMCVRASVHICHRGVTIHRTIDASRW